MPQHDTLRGPIWRRTDGGRVAISQILAENTISRIDERFALAAYLTDLRNLHVMGHIDELRNDHAEVQEDDDVGSQRD